MSAQRVPLPPQPFPFPSHRSPVPRHRSKHYSLLPTAKLVAASVGDLEMGKSDIFARHSVTDIIASASPSRALHTLEVPCYARLPKQPRRHHSSLNVGETTEN
jgi:hypothetical protein